MNVKICHIYVDTTNHMKDNHHVANSDVMLYQRMSDVL